MKAVFIKMDDATAITSKKHILAGFDTEGESTGHRSRRNFVVFIHDQRPDAGE